MPRTIRMPSADEIDKSYTEAIPKVAEKYSRRVKQTVGFKEAALGGETTYEEVMRKVIDEKRRYKGLEKIDDKDWKDGVELKGKAIIGKHMKIMAPKRKSKYDPYRDTLDGLEIPDKGADPIENARTIVPVVVEALVKKKREILGL